MFFVKAESSMKAVPSTISMPSSLVETDRLDREAFARECLQSKPLNEIMEIGKNLLPGFDQLAQDIFAVFYKYNVVVRPLEEQPRWFVVHKQILDWVLSTPTLEDLKSPTRLNSTQSAFAATGILEQVLDILRTPPWFDETNLLAQWRLKSLEEHLQDINEKQQAAEELLEELGESDEDGRASLERQHQEASAEASELKKELDSRALAAEQDFQKLPARPEYLIRQSVKEAASRMSDYEEAANSMGDTLGINTRGLSVRQKLSLGEHLLKSDKLQKLAELVGLFKEVARSERRHVLERRPTTLHEIGQGRDLARILCSELVLLRHPLRKREFLRRYVDGLLTQYAISGDVRSGRGPLVVCIDGSGSMRGAREIWSKAIALTFLEIARKQRRAFRAIVFSGGVEDTKEFELLDSALRPRLRPPIVDPEMLVAFSEYFPSGGTDFERPLSLAIESLQTDRYRRGDIVFITDGACRISHTFRAYVTSQKEHLGFRIFAVLVDIKGATGESLSAFADEILPVSELKAEVLGSVFRQI